MFDFGECGPEMWLNPGGGGVFTPADIVSGIVTTGGERNVFVTNVLRSKEWFHIAFASGSGGLRLFLNGVLVVTNASTASFAAVGNGDKMLRTFLTSYFRPKWPRRGFGRLAGLAS